MIPPKLSKTANLFAGVQVILTCRGVWGRAALMFFPPSAVPPLTDEKRSFESRRAQCMTAGNSAGALELDKSSSRH